MTIEVDLREIKNMLSELNKKIDVLIEEKETLALMALSEKSLKDFLEKEPDIYSIKDVKAKVKCSWKEKPEFFGRLKGFLSLAILILDLHVRVLV